MDGLGRICTSAMGFISQGFKGKPWSSDHNQMRRQLTEGTRETYFVLGENSIVKAIKEFVNMG